jgi:hypothetical protein
MSFSSVVDSILMLVILLLAFNALRKVTFFSEPLQTLAFLAMTIGAAKSISWRFSGHEIHWWVILVHAGFALYAVRIFNAARYVRLRFDVLYKAPPGVLKRTNDKR